MQNYTLYLTFNLFFLICQTLFSVVSTNRLATTEGRWVGKAEKWRSLFWGVGLAVRCERSEHGKSQLSKKYLCSILYCLFKSFVLFIFFFITLNFYIVCNFQPYLTLFFRFPIALSFPHCLQRFSSLASGRGIGKARTGGELPKSCEVSHETTPPLAPNCLLGAVVFFYILPLFIRTNCQSTTNCKSIDFMRIVKIAEYFFL